jgi:hypothetical protein
MMLDEQKKRDIAIILQTEQYRGVKVDEELIVQILGELADSIEKVESVISDSNKPQGAGTYIV